jgi:hypothetical protein
MSAPGLAERGKRVQNRRRLRVSRAMSRTAVPSGGPRVAIDHRALETAAERTPKARMSRRANVRIGRVPHIKTGARWIRKRGMKRSIMIR